MVAKKKHTTKSDYKSKITQTSPLVSILIGAKDRPNALIRCVQSVLTQTYKHFEIIIFDDNSQVDLAEQISKEIDDNRITFMRSNVTCGVAGSRNRMTGKAKGDFFVTLDDDAAFRNNDSLNKIVDLFNSYPDVALFAFKIINIINQKEADIKIPFTRAAIKRNPAIVNSPQYVCYFLGGGHAIRKRAFEKCGPYQDDLLFGAEETDLAYSLINNGYKLYYAPEVIVEHFPDNSTILLQATRKKYPYYYMRNKIWINYKYLPWFYFFVNTIVWCAIRVTFSFRDGGGFLQVVRGMKDGLKGLKRLKRTPINKKAIRYIRRNHGRLFF